MPHSCANTGVDEDLSDEQYKAILDFEMPSEELNHLPVFSIRTSKPRPDDKAKTEYYEWGGLPELELT